MSTSRDSCCLPSVKKQKHDFQVFACLYKGFMNKSVLKYSFLSVFIFCFVVGITAGLFYQVLKCKPKFWERYDGYRGRTSSSLIKYISY